MGHSVIRQTPAMTCPDDERVRFSETAAFVRHYSNLRFSILTVYLTLSGGCVALLTAAGDSNLSTPTSRAAVLVGFVFSVAFGLFERRLGEIDSTLYDALRDARLGANLMPDSQSGSTGLVTRVMISIYAFGGIFWLVTLLTRVG